MIRLRWWPKIVGLVLLAGLLAVPTAPASAAATTVYHLGKDKKNYVLDLVAPVAKGHRKAEAKVDGRYDNPYLLMGSWQAKPAAEAARLINLSDANLWLSQLGPAEDPEFVGDELLVQVKLEVFHNGLPVVAKESGCLALNGVAKGFASKKFAVPITSIDLPAPFPAVDFAVGDILSIKISARQGVAVSGCTGGPIRGKVKLWYDGRDTDSYFGAEFSGARPAAKFIAIGDPSYIAPDGTAFVTGQTPLTVGVLADLGLASCTLIATFPDLTQVTVPCAGGGLTIRLQGLPDGRYNLRLVTVDVSGSTAEEFMEVTLDSTLVVP